MPAIPRSRAVQSWTGGDAEHEAAFSPPDAPRMLPLSQSSTAGAWRGGQHGRPVGGVFAPAADVAGSPSWCRVGLIAVREQCPRIRSVACSSCESSPVVGAGTWRCPQCSYANLAEPSVGHASAQSLCGVRVFHRLRVSAGIFATQPEYVSGRSIAGLVVFVVPLVIALVVSFAYVRRVSGGANDDA